MWLTIWQLIAISKGTLCYVISICLDKLGMPKHVLRTRPTCTLYFFSLVVDEKIQNQCTPFSPKSSLSKGPLCHLICIFVYNLAISAINRHFRQIRHFRQYRHFPKGPFAISFEFLFTVWRVWRLITISGIFAEIATFQRAPFPSHLNFC